MKPKLQTLTNLITLKEDDIMTREFAQDRVTKAEEFITKKQGTIARHQKTIAKKVAELAKKYNFTYTVSMHLSEVKALGYNDNDAWDISWATSDIAGYEENIREAQRAIEEKEAKLVEYRRALAEVEEQERILADEIPDSLKEAKEELVKKWTAWDIEYREVLRAKRQEMDYKEFNRTYGYSTWMRYNKSKEELLKENEKDARVWLLDLYNRVKDITGKIIDAKNLRWGKALNGYIIGEDGKAVVTTIEAGGYNIQRWHLRVLVHRA